MRNASGQQGENERQWKNYKRTEHKQQNFWWVHTTIPPWHKWLVSRKFHVLVDNNGEEMYRKMCCTCKFVVFANQSYTSKFTFFAIRSIDFEAILIAVPF